MRPHECWTQCKQTAGTGREGPLKGLDCCQTVEFAVGFLELNRGCPKKLGSKSRLNASALPDQDPGPLSLCISGKCTCRNASTFLETGVAKRAKSMWTASNGICRGVGIVAGFDHEKGTTYIGPSAIQGFSNSLVGLRAAGSVQTQMLIMAGTTRSVMMYAQEDPHFGISNLHVSHNQNLGR